MDVKIVGSYIRDKRTARGWTQEELAERVGVSNKTVSTWENGSFSSIKNDNLDSLSGVLGVSISEIWMGRDMDGLDEETKEQLDRELRSLNEKLEDVRNVTIKVEDRGLLSIEMGTYAFGMSLFAVALAWWAASDRSALFAVVCTLLGLFGLFFFFAGGRIVRSLTKRVQRSRKPEDKE